MYFNSYRLLTELFSQHVSKYKGSSACVNSQIRKHLRKHFTLTGLLLTDIKQTLKDMVVINSTAVCKKPQFRLKGRVSFYVLLYRVSLE